MGYDFYRLREYLPNYLMQECNIANVNKNFACPVCGSGTVTGCCSWDRNRQRIKCFNPSCDFTGDIFDLMREKEGLSISEAVKVISERYEGKPVKSLPVKKKEAVSEDFTEYLSRCAADEHAADYFKERGISEAVIVDHRLGYDAQRHLAIIPYSDTFYIGRATVEGTGKYFRPAGVTKTAPYNARRLLESSSEPLICAEGEINALSLESIGFASIGLGSSSDWRVLIDYIDRNRVNRPLIICLDFDAAGQGAQTAIETALADRKIPCKSLVYPFSKEDINDTLRKNKEALIEYMTKEKEDFIKEIGAGESVSPLQEISGNSALDRLLAKVQNPDFKPIPTGFAVLDRKLGGGLYSGLVTLSAAPSEGKSALAMNIVENIAEQQGRNILIFSLEMSEEQLVSRTISRLTYEIGEQNPERALTALEYMQSYKEGAKVEGDKLYNREKAEKRYRDKIGGKVFVLDKSGASLPDITAEIERYSFNGKAPIIVLDYVQLVDVPGKEFVAAGKDITLALKQYAIKNDTIVLAISAVNRDAQRNGTSLTSGYGSSFLEYSADLAFTLDFTKVKFSKKASEVDKDELKRQPVREMTLTITKNRMGVTGDYVHLKYAAPYNHFSDTPTEAQLAEDVQRIEEKENGGVFKGMKPMWGGGSK